MNKKLILSAFSDLHITFDNVPKHVNSAIESILLESPDFILIGGDIGNTKKEISYGLSLFRDYKGHKLAYLGNHELMSIEDSVFGDHYQEMSELFSRCGFHLLDDKPFVIDGIGFVGNSGFYDFSMFKGDNREKLEKLALKQHYSMLNTNKTPQECTDICVKRVNLHIKEIENQCDTIYLGIHHVGFKELLKYGQSEKYDYKNFFMGSERLSELYDHPKIKTGFCGHTHRFENIEIDERRIYNISSKPNSPYLKIEVK